MNFKAIKRKRRCHEIWLIFLVIAGCNDFKVIHREEIIEFDRNNKYLINSLCDSMRGAISNDTNYIIQFGRSNKDIFITAFDDEEQVSGDLSSRFKPTEAQSDFIDDAGIGSIRFKKNNLSFYMKLFHFKVDERAIWLIVSPKESKALFQSFDSVIYSKEGRYYVWGHAWL